MIWWRHNKEFQVLLEGALKSPDAFFEGNLGELLDADGTGRELRRLSLEWKGQSQLFFLKRIGREPVGKLLRTLFYGRKPSSGPIRELLMIQALQKAEISVMRPVVWGEERRFGMPVRGFLLVEGVSGSDVADIFVESSTAKRKELCLALGRFVGGLHLAGFYQPVRLKDVFCSFEKQGDDPKFSFTLIDRETSKPWPSRFSPRRCVHSLSRAYRRTVRDGYRFGRGELRALCKGYLEVLTTRWQIRPKQLRREIYTIVRKES